MAYDAPDASGVKARYPEFEPVADARVSAVIAEASRFVDNSWIEADYSPAIVHLTAHMLVREGALDAGVSAQRGPLTSVRLGDASESYATRGAGEGAGSSDLKTTAYGQSFLRLLRANQGGPRTTTVTE